MPSPAQKLNLIKILGVYKKEGPDEPTGERRAF
jgi:hypothetical protein